MGTPHISASKDEISKHILLVNEPEDSSYIADRFFSNPVLFNEIRGMYGYTGECLGQRISVLAIGIGIPSAAIYTHELLEQYGIKKIVHLTGCSSMGDHLEPGDILLASGCCTDNDFIRHSFKGDFAPIAEYTLLEKTYNYLLKHNISPHVGLLKSSDVIYLGTQQDDIWKQHGVLGVDTTSAVIYTLAARFGAQALAIATVGEKIICDVFEDVIYAAIQSMEEAHLN